MFANRFDGELRPTYKASRAYLLLLRESGQCFRGLPNPLISRLYIYRFLLNSDELPQQLDTRNGGCSRRSVGLGLSGNSAGALMSTDGDARDADLADQPRGIRHGLPSWGAGWEIGSGARSGRRQHAGRSAWRDQRGGVGMSEFKFVLAGETSTYRAALPGEIRIGRKSARSFLSTSSI